MLPSSHAQVVVFVELPPEVSMVLQVGTGIVSKSVWLYPIVPGLIQCIG